MFRRIGYMLLFVLMILGTFSGNVLAESSESKEYDIRKVKNYIESSVDYLKEQFGKLDKMSNLADIESIIEGYYNENPPPEAMLKGNLKIEDVLPELTEANEKYHQMTKGDLNEFLEIQKKNEELGKVFLYKNDNSKIEVYLGNTGEIAIMEFRTIKEAPIQPLYAQRETAIERTTGIAYNAVGSKMFTLWSEGGFKYNGSNVVSQNIDGDFQRHFWGSTLNLIPETMPKTRAISIEGYKYVEIYSRLRYEAGIGIRWASITLKSGTIETIVGCGVNGSVYGQLKRVSC